MRTNNNKSSSEPLRVGALMSQLLNDFQTHRLLPTLTAGLVAGILVIILQISFAALIFTGDLSGYVSSGIGITLFGAFVVGIVVALTSSFPGVVAFLQGSPAVILALMATAIASGMPASATPEDTFLTVVAGIALTSLVTGVFLLALGWFKLGSLIRFIPYPVIGGFLAGTGWLLIVGALGVMTDVSLSFSKLPHLLQSHMLIKWVPGLIFAVLLLVTERRYSHFLVIPAMLVSAIALFYLILVLSDTSVTKAGALGFLLGPFPGDSIWRPLSFSALQQVNWLLIFGQAGKLGTILILIVISLLLNASGLELTTRQDVDLNRELQSTGVANLVSGFGSGPVGYLALSLSVLGHKMESNSRLVGLLSATLCGATLFFGASLLSFLPKPVLGALLFFLGLSFLVEWVYDGWFKLPRADYFIVLLILLVIGLRGFLDGVGMGLVIAVILFVVKYSGINVVKQALSGANSASNVDRPSDHRRLLHNRGEELFILRLQGFIFFGTAHNLFRRVRQRADDPHLPALYFVVLDFARVTGLDSSAEISFIKMIELARSRGIKLIFSHMTPELQSQLEKTVFTEENRATFRIFPDQDHGIEWCENQILTAENLLPAEEKQSLLTYLEQAFPESIDVSKIMQYLEKKEVGEGYYLMREGEASEDLYFIESGQVIAKITAQTEPQNKSGDLESESSKTIRLRTMQAGTVVGEVGMYLGIPRTASVITNKPTTLYRLSASALRQMEEKDPEIASAFHQFIARLLAERLADNSRTIQALSD